MEKYFIKQSAAPFERILNELVQRGGKLLTPETNYHPAEREGEVWLISDNDGFIRHSGCSWWEQANFDHCGYVELRYRAEDDSFYECIKPGVWVRYRDRVPEKGRPILRASRGPGFRTGTRYYTDLWCDNHDVEKLIEMEKQTGNEYWWQYIAELGKENEE